MTPEQIERVVIHNDAEQFIQLVEAGAKVLDNPNYFRIAVDNVFVDGLEDSLLRVFVMIGALHFNHTNYLLKNILAHNNLELLQFYLERGYRVPESMIHQASAQALEIIAKYQEV